MRFRQLGRTGVKLSTISAGAMQFAREDVPQEVATAIVARAVELGVNFIETSPFYGDSEDKIGAALEATGLRGRAMLSTKASRRVAATADALKAAVEKSLSRLRTDHLEFYHLWFVNSMEVFEELTAPGGTLDGIRELRDQGVIDHIGITSHAQTREIIRMIDTGWFESVTIYYNAFQSTDAPVLDAAERLGMGVIAMGPLNGGLLGSDSEKLAFLRTGVEATNAQAALRWLVSDPRVTTAIVGFDTVAHVESAVPVSDMRPMSAREREEISQTFAALRKKADSTCTSCGYCQPCPQGVTIPAILCGLSRYQVLGSLDYERRKYQQIDAAARADRCTQCGACLDKCPQHLPIPALLEIADQVFGQ